MRTINGNAFYEACLLVFQGVTYREISKQLGITPTTISNWAKRPDWKELQKEFHAQKRQQVLNAIGGKDTAA